MVADDMIADREKEICYSAMAKFLGNTNMNYVYEKIF